MTEEDAFQLPRQVQLPAVLHPKGRLTEYEVRMAGLTSTALIAIRTLAANCSSGGTVTTKGGTLNLTTNDIEAVLALLTERGENLLIQLDIQLDREGTR